MPDPIVAYCAVTTEWRHECWAEVERQWPAARMTPLRPGFDYDYADEIRRLWRVPGDLVIVEQDVTPPPGAIQGLLDCPNWWCTHPHRVGSRHLTDTLGLAKFSAYLKRSSPDLADDALAPFDPRVATREGWTNVGRASSKATIERRGRRACVRQDAEVPPVWWDARTRPSNVHWSQCDNRLARLLRGLALEPHVHQPPTRHLHLY